MDTQPAQTSTPAPETGGPSHRQTIMELVEGCVKGWQQDHGLAMELEPQVVMMAMRVNSWIAPRSVVAGVVDIMAPVRCGNGKPSSEQIEQLGNHLAGLLNEHGLLAAQPRRGGILG